MVRIIPGDTSKLQYPEPLIFREMPLAHRLCRGVGIELGAAAHNPFHLPGCINVAPSGDDPSSPDYENFLANKAQQEAMCGAYAAVDLVGEANALPVPDASQDYIISSHVVEHIPDLIGAFFEWNRVLRTGGVAFMIFPKRDAEPGDVGRPITPIEHFVEDFELRRTMETHPVPEGMDRRMAHLHVFSLWSMLRLIEYCGRVLKLGWCVTAAELTDSKVGNGHTVVARKEG